MSGSRSNSGKQKFNLRQTGTSGSVTCKVDAPGSFDLCFIADGSLQPVIERLKNLGIAIIVGPGPRTGALGRMTSIYCEHPKPLNSHNETDQADADRVDRVREAFSTR